MKDTQEEWVQLPLWPKEVLDELTVPPSNEVDQGSISPISRGKDAAYIQLSFPEMETD